MIGLYTSRPLELIELIRKSPTLSLSALSRVITSFPFLLTYMHWLGVTTRVKGTAFMERVDSFVVFGSESPLTTDVTEVLWSCGSLFAISKMLWTLSPSLIYESLKTLIVSVPAKVISDLRISMLPE